MDTPKILTVSQINTYIKSIITSDPKLKYVFMEGEISNFTNHYASGHLYFSLKDSKSVISAVMFKYAAQNLKFDPSDGMKVICRGKITLYEPTGKYQIQIEDMQPDGIGVLALQFEQLKEKLSKKGYFDEDHKKEIPEYPVNVGVITSKTGAAVQDIKNILRRRCPSINIILAPVLVQGEGAPEDLTNAIKKFDKLSNIDVIIIGRGGGSIEDLWAFNSEMLADAIYNCKIPVISAVGHETDFTICDFVSDLRAPTPSAAAELCVPDYLELISNLDTQKHYLDTILDNKLESISDKLDNISYILSMNSPSRLLSNQKDNLLSKSKDIKTYYKQVVERELKANQIKLTTIESISPINTLKRGYAYVTKDGKNVSTKKGIKVGDMIEVKVSDADIKAKVEGID